MEFRDYLASTSARVLQSMPPTFDLEAVRMATRSTEGESRDPLPLCKSQGEVIQRLQARNKGRLLGQPGLCRRHIRGGRRIAFMVQGDTEYALHATKGWRIVGRVKS